MDSKLPLKDKVNDMTQIAKQLIDLAFVSNQNKQKAQSQPGQSQNLDPNTVNLYSKESNLYHQEKLVNLLQNIETSYNKKVDLAVNQRVLLGRFWNVLPSLPLNFVPSGKKPKFSTPFLAIQQRTKPPQRNHRQKQPTKNFSQPSEKI